MIHLFAELFRQRKRSKSKSKVKVQERKSDVEEQPKLQVGVAVGGVGSNPAHEPSPPSQQESD